ncbi:TatD family hydrolase [Kushneria phosphatilytica]|uniref:TatD family deoxyribonuclease n=1 Tax=Kushneria phosphatilytica TaxID=657387 RepID=A0A1S1NYM9_9GAMM|nr:TatD family hydrolase [Kushneria phosphatilytica]OHV11963.1 hydrolase TatD [Kushneria phosphatilytica]QEL11148.1 TatD family deoxyribonuclease [Kushneria phosphatilytica]
MSRFTDAHCHLDFEDFESDREAVLERARAEDIQRFIVPGTRRSRFEAVMALNRFTGVATCLGLHPFFLDEHEDEGDLVALEHALMNQPVVGLGECGVDARLDDLPRQWRLFDAQLKLARHMQLPVVVHCVHLNDEVGKRLKQLALPARGLIHAFSGSQQQARRFIELGYLLGIGGAVTHDRAQKLKRIVAELPEETFVLETDAPDMAPQGVKGRNEPACMKSVINEVSRLRGVDREALAATTSANAARLFGLTD